LTPGTLLFVEQPFAYVHLKSNEALIDDPSHLSLFSITQKLEQRNTADGDASSGGKYLRQSSLELIKQLETRILIDPKFAMEKLSHLMPLRQKLQRQQKCGYGGGGGDDDDSFHELPYKLFLELYERNVIIAGIWPKLSRFNHSCLPNCTFIVLNHVCYASVLQPIEIGEELTICYLPSVYSSYIERTIRLRDHYIDQCQCSLCLFDRFTGQAELQQLCRQFEEHDDNEDKRRYLFKHMIYRFSSNRPLGFIEQMNQLKRSVTIDIFIEQVKHGYLTHPYVLKYLRSHLHKYNRLKSVFEQLNRQFAYFNVTFDQTTSLTNDQKEQWIKLIELLFDGLPDGIV
jgi:hypothetical protein